MADVHWRNSMRTARFFTFDARAGASIFLLLVYPRMPTIYFAVVTMVIFYILERLGLTFEAALRRARCWLAGQERPAHVATARRRLVDFGSND